MRQLILNGPDRVEWREVPEPRIRKRATRSSNL